MFQAACRELLNNLTPIATAWRTEKGIIRGGLGACYILNDQGWFITAAHIIKQIGELEAKAKASAARKGRRPDNTFQYTSVFGVTSSAKLKLQQAIMLEQIDLGIGKLGNFTPSEDRVFPRLRTRKIEQGEFLCRAGYPFIQDIRVTWDSKTGFDFANLFPTPMFVNEAMVSRFARLSTGVWIETSSPGLQGQSGGPLVDSSGNVCGIQVNTKHYPLDFQGTGRGQVLNVGRAVHAETIRKGLNDHNIEYLSE